MTPIFTIGVKLCLTTTREAKKEPDVDRNLVEEHIGKQIECLDLQLKAFTHVFSDTVYSHPRLGMRFIPPRFCFIPFTDDGEKTVITMPRLNASIDDPSNTAQSKMPKFHFSLASLPYEIGFASKRFSITRTAGGHVPGKS